MITNRDDVGIAIRYAFLRKGTQQKFSLVALIIVSILLLYIDSFDSKPLNATKSIIKDIKLSVIIISRSRRKSTPTSD